MMSKSKRILFLADPNSIHDRKWITPFIKQYGCYLVCRHVHKRHISGKFSEVKVLGTLNDLSVVKIWNTIKSALFLWKIIIRYKIDIFHIHFAEPNALWAILTSFLVPKVILTTRGTDILKTIPNHFTTNNLANVYVRILYKIAFKRIDLFTCTSQSQKISLKKHFRIDDEKITIIRTGVDLSLVVTDTTQELPLALKGKKFLLFPRDMRPLYNHEFELEGISRLPKDILLEYSFVFVDEKSVDQEYVKKIKHLMSKIPNANFIFLKKQPSIALIEMYKQSSLVIMTPLSDGSPVTAMEAMACRVPVILGPLPYDTQVFNDDTIIKLSDWDSQELANTIHKTLTQANEKLTHQAHIIINESCSYEKEMSKLSNLYKQ